MPEIKISRALKFREEDIEVNLIGREDNSNDAEARFNRVQDMVAKMVSLGRKRGRPKHEEESYEEAA